MEYVALAAVVAVLAVSVPAGISALHRAGQRSGGSYAPARIFASRHYGYTEALPVGWRLATQATQRWDGRGAPGDADNVVDLFAGRGGVEAWVYAAPTKKNLAAYAITTVRLAGTVHSCPVIPQTNRDITIGGTPAKLLEIQCPAGSGFLVELAVTIHHGIGLVIGSQNPTGITPTDQPADRAAFRKFLAGIQLQR